MSKIDVWGNKIERFLYRTKHIFINLQAKSNNSMTFNKRCHHNVMLLEYFLSEL